jgi:transcriptional regulator with XRE-family HTH domain
VIKCYPRFDLKEYCSKKSVSGSELAKTAGVSPSMISKIFGARANPNIQTAFDISEALGLSFDSVWAIQDAPLQQFEQILDTRKKVEAILKDEPFARNSDRYLIIRFSQRFGSGSLEADILNTNFPAPESITRRRRELRHKYPSDKRTELKRRDLEKLHVKYYSR